MLFIYSQPVSSPIHNSILSFLLGGYRASKSGILSNIPLNRDEATRSTSAMHSINIFQRHTYAFPKALGSTDLTIFTNGSPCERTVQPPVHLQLEFGIRDLPNYAEAQ